MPRPKSSDTADATIRWRDRQELQLRMERLALFFDMPWNKLASCVLAGHATAQEKKCGIPYAGAPDELPRVRFTSVASLSALARARYDFFTAQLEALHHATSPEQREAIASREFTAEEWLAGRGGSVAVLTRTAPRATKRKMAKAATDTRTIFRDLPLGDGPAGVPVACEFRPAAWGETLRVKIKDYPRAAFALRVHGHSMTGAGIKDRDILVFAVPSADDDLSGRVVAAHIDGGEVTIKTLVRRNGKTTLKAENPKYPDPIITKNSAVQGVMVGKPIRQRKART